LRGLVDALGGGDRGATEFLDNDSHDVFPEKAKRGSVKDIVGDCKACRLIPSSFVRAI
jgi:hypothetical protein